MTEKTCKNGHVQSLENVCVKKTKLKSGGTRDYLTCLICRDARRKKITDSFHLVEKRKPTIEELTDASIKNISWVELARRCGVSDVALRKQAKRLGLLT